MRLKNKSSIALIVIGALVMALAIALAACNAHQHAFSDEWSFDDSGHWHAATCGDTDEVRDMAEHAIVWGEVTSPATCETAGVQKGSCLCGYTTTRPVEATGHDFAPSWGWNSDFSSAILTLTCGNDPEHTHTVTATVSSEDGADACSDYVIHTATATYDGKTYTDSKRIETESHHLYELSEWIWDGDLSGSKAKFVCQRDASHVLESERVASVETGAHEDATCTVDGYTEYKVSVQLNGQTYEGTAENGGIMRKTLTKLGHDFDTPWQYDEGQHWHKCSRCDETDAHVGHTLNGDGECATCGYTQITPVDEFDFSENGSSWRITGYNGSRTNMVIPSEYRGLPVTEIGMRAFYGCESIRKLTIPQTITGMGSDVFIGCVNIEEVTSPAIDLTSVPKDSLRKLTLTSGSRIEANAFKDYTLLAEITFPDSIRYVGKDAFTNTAWLAKQSGDTYIGKVYYQYVGEMPAEYELRLRDDTAYITEYACYGQTGLASLMIPDSVTSIGNQAFSGCTGLHTVTIGEGVTSIGAQAFAGCTGIIHLVTPVNYLPIISKENIKILTVTKGSIPANAFENNTGLEILTIGEGVTEIGDSAFSGCTGLQTVNWNATNCTTTAGIATFSIFEGCIGLATVNIGENVESIPKYAFRDCTGLKTVNWNATNCTYAGNDYYPIYKGCTGLATVNIGENVKNIPAYAFYGCTRLNEILIPDSVTSIGESAFSGCTGLTEITIPGSVTSIEYMAFSDCTGLKTVTIGDGVESISNYAFHHCTGLQTVNWNATNCTTAGSSSSRSIFGDYTRLRLATVNIGENVECIPAYAFSGCTELTEITIPNSVTSIGERAFSGCTGLQTVTIGEGVESIDYEAFSVCTRLQTVTIPESVTSIGSSAFSGCTGLQTVTIPDSVKSIGSSAFSGCTGLQTVNWNATNCTTAGDSNHPIFKGCTGFVTVNIGENVESIPANAFQDFTGLHTVIISDNVKSIGEHAFYHCTGLRTVTIPGSVTSIGWSAFSGCTGLQTVTIPDSVTSIGDYAFSGCTSITTVTMPANDIAYVPQNSLTTVTITSGDILSYAFEDCTGLQTVTIGEGVGSIGNWAFSGCTGITRVNYLGDLKGWCEIEFGSSYANPLSYANAKLYVKENGEEKEITGELSIPIGTTKIGDSAFYGLKGITSVTIPDSVTSIGSSAFSGCTGLTAYTVAEENSVYQSKDGVLYKKEDKSIYLVPSAIEGAVTILDGCTSIGYYAFSGRTGLGEITIPNSVTSIDNYAFKDCTGITRVNYLGALKDWCEIEFGNGGANPLNGGNAKLYVKENGEEKEIKGELIIPVGIEKTGAYAFSGLTGITSVTIPDSVTSIGDYAFLGCTGLQTATIPNSVTSIGDYAFSGCTGLKTVTIPNSVTSIGDKAFYNCTSLQTVTIPDSVTSIGWEAFDGCTGLQTVTIGSGVTSIGNYAFDGCTGLHTVTIESGSIGSYAFRDCTGLQTVTIGEGVKSIDNNAFYGCTSITTVIMPAIAISRIPKYNLNTVTITSGDIPREAFYKCTYLQTLTIGENVPSIGVYAFRDCTGLQTVTIPESVTSIGDSAFSGCTGITKVVAYSLNDWCEIEFGDSSANPLYAASGNAKLYVQENGEEKEITGEVNIPVGTTMIGKGAFYGLKGITSVTIPDSVTSIGYSAFSGCTGITRVNYLGALKDWCEIEFGNGGANPLNGGNAKLYVKENGAEKEVTCDINIPVGTTKIGKYAFYGLTGITSVTIPDSVTSIGSGAFNGCTGITMATIPAIAIDSIPKDNLNTVTITSGYIPKEVFKDCTGLQTVTIGASVTNIGENAFSGCKDCTVIVPANTITGISKESGIENIMIKNGDIPASAFINNTQLKTVKICEGVTSIGNYAFQGCTGLQTVTIPESVTSIGNYAFKGCTGLQTVTIPESVTSIGNYTFSDCTGLHTVTIGDGVTGIGNYAFKGCTGLQTVTIGENVTSIGVDAFYNCTGITKVVVSSLKGWCEIEFGNSYANPLSYANAKLYVKENGAEKVVTGEVNIPVGTTKIGIYAFYKHTGITSVMIPDSVTSIGERAFYNCTGLQTVTIGSGVTSIGVDAFYNSGITRVNYLGDLKGWCEIEFGNSYANPLSYANAKLYVKENGEEKVVTGEVNIPVGTTKIGIYAFYGLTGITSVTIPDSVTSIGWSAFLYCTGLQTVNWNATNCTTAGDSNHPIFKGCAGLATVNIGEDVESIPAYAFYDFTGLQTVTIGSGVTSIGYDAFYKCTGLQTVTIPDSVKSIGSSAFSGCTGLKTVNWNATNCTTAGGYNSPIFEGCTGLTTVNIGENVENIPGYAFFNCKNLKDIYYAGSSIQWGQITKGNRWDEYYSNGSYYAINYKMHYDSTGPSAAAVSSSEATGYEGQERIAEVRVPEAWIKQD